MTQNQWMTYGAAGFAGFALWWISRKPGSGASVQPGQQARDGALQSFLDLRTSQADEIEATSYALSREQFAHLLGQP